jgi:AcrR family transcriptional regulator
VTNKMSKAESGAPITGAAQGKRDRLIRAASTLVHHQGVERTTLAEIAEQADVPLGNVYYYFKSKDSLLEAVVDGHVHGIDDTIASLARYRTPKGRLKGLARLLTGRGNDIARFGCPHGTLCSEVGKTADDNGGTRRLLAVPLGWLEEQFRLMGRKDAHALAIRFLVSYQGTAVLTHALRDPTLLTEEGKRLERWIDSLDTTRRSGTPEDG